MERDLYPLDDILLRAGGLCAVVVFVGLWAVLAKGREAIDALRAEHRFEDAPACGIGLPKDFSLPTFLLLLCLCWPGAIFYAWHRSQGRL